jgi:hypothetical protein
MGLGGPIKILRILLPISTLCKIPPFLTRPATKSPEPKPSGLQFVFILALATFLTMTHLPAFTLLVGNFSAQDPAESQQGLHVLRLDDTGLSAKPQVLPFQNPEFLCQHPTKMTFYTVNVISNPSSKKTESLGIFSV